MFLVQLRSLGSYQQCFLHPRHDGKRTGVHRFPERQTLAGHDAHPEPGMFGFRSTGGSVRHGFLALRVRLHQAVSKPVGDLALHPLRVDRHPRSSHVAPYGSSSSSPPTDSGPCADRTECKTFGPYTGQGSTFGASL